MYILLYSCAPFSYLKVTCVWCLVFRDAIETQPKQVTPDLKFPGSLTEPTLVAVFIIKLYSRQTIPTEAGEMSTGKQATVN